MSNEVISLTEEYIPQVRTFGALGYSAERICKLLNLRGKEKVAMLLRLSMKGDIYYDSYENGRAIGELNIDSELAKKAETGDTESITLLETRKNERIQLDLRKKLFGI